MEPAAAEPDFVTVIAHSVYLRSPDLVGIFNAVGIMTGCAGDSFYILIRSSRRLSTYSLGEIPLCRVAPGAGSAVHMLRIGSFAV
jgi:hypothetical protein